MSCRFCTEAEIFGWRQAIFTSTCVQCEDRALAALAALKRPPPPPKPTEDSQ